MGQKPGCALEHRPYLTQSEGGKGCWGGVTIQLSVFQMRKLETAAGLPHVTKAHTLKPNGVSFTVPTLNTSRDASPALTVCLHLLDGKAKAMGGSDSRLTQFHTMVPPKSAYR